MWNFRSRAETFLWGLTSMDFEKDFPRALRETEVHRMRRPRLLTFGSTELPYVLLGTSLVNLGDTVVRRGVVRVEKPNIYLLTPQVQLEGFDEERVEGERTVVAVGRTATFPPGKYSNIDNQLDVVEGSLQAALAEHMQRLDREEDVLTGLLSGPVELWPMSLLVYVGMMVGQSAEDDVRNAFFKQGVPRHWS